MQKRVVLTSVLSGPGPSTSTHGGKENGVQSSSSSSVHKNRPTSSSSSPPVTSSGKKSSKASNETSNNKTIRIQIKLQPPTNDSFPEFFYDELMKKADKNNNNKSSGPRDPFEEDDEDEMKRLARSFEEKYGGGSSSGKNKKPIGGRRSEWEDYVDKGMGYDETDPFIDNDEAYDELIPHELTTKYGGFYVNTGQLEFKVVSNSDQEESQDNNKRLPAAVVAANMNQAAKRRKSVDSSKELKKKKKKSLEAASILSPVSSSQVKSSAKDDQSDNIIAVKKKKTPIIVSDDEEETPKTGSPCDKNVDDVIESVVRGAKHDSRTNEENPGRPKVFDITTTPTSNNINNNNNNNNNPNPIQRTKSHTPPSSQVLPESRVEGLAMSSLARMANIARNEQKPSSQQQQQQQQQQPNRVHAPSKTGSSRHPRAVITDPGPSAASTDHQNLNHNKISNQPASSPQAQLFNRKHDVSQLLMPQPSSSTQRTSSKNKPHPSSSQQLMSSQGNPKQQPISGYFHKQTSPQSIVEKVISDGLQMYPSASSSSPNHSRPSLDSKSSQHRSPSSFLQPPAAHSSSTGQSSHHPYVSFMETVNSSSNKTGSHRVLNLPPKTSSSPQEGLSSRTLTPSPSQGQQQQQHQQLQRCNSSGSKDRRVDNNNRPPSSHVRGGPPAGNSSHVSDSSFTPHFPSVIQSPTHAGWPSLDLYGGLHNSLLFRNTSPTSPANPLVSMGAGSAHHHANVMARHFLNQLHSQSPSTSSTSGEI